MNPVADKTKEVSKDGLLFFKEVAKYFMDFLETDFHKRKFPRRSIKFRNNDNFLIGLNLQKYETFNKLILELINKNFEKGDDKAKRAILACLGSNLTLKGKKVFVNYHSFIKTLIKSRQAVEDELEHARTSKVSSNKRQNPTKCEVSSLGLPN